MDADGECYGHPGRLNFLMITFRDWNVDLIPKFLMANGRLVQLLIHTGNYLWSDILEHYMVMLLILLKWTSFKQIHFCSELLTRRIRSGIY